MPGASLPYVPDWVPEPHVIEEMERLQRELDRKTWLTRQLEKEHQVSIPTPEVVK